jgi:hypothetical protein
VPTKERGRPLTPDCGAGGCLSRKPGVKCVIPAHVDGWAHFSEGVDDFVAAFDRAGISNLLKVARHGEWIDWADG